MSEIEFLPRKIQDDFVFIFRKGEDVRVFGIGDAGKYKYKLQDKGFKHTATLSASTFLERLLRCPDMGKAIDLILNVDK